MIACILVQCKQYTPTDLAGIYVNHNYNYPPFIPDIPYIKDTLWIKNDFTFKSNYFGNGHYHIYNEYMISKIRLIYTYQFGQAGLTRNLGRDKTGKVKIILYRDQNHYYKKIN